MIEMVFQAAQNMPGTSGAEASPDWHLSLRVSGSGYARSSARLALDDDLVLECQLVDLSAFCSNSLNRPVREWSQVVREWDGASLFHALLQIADCSPGRLQSLFKACFMTYLWCEPQVISEDTAAWDHQLIDEYILRAEGMPSPVPYLYFLPEDISSSSEHRASLLVLYQLCLLGRLTIIVDDERQCRWFKPLVVPGTARWRFDPGIPEGGPNYRLWLRILERIERKFKEDARFSRR